MNGYHEHPIIENRSSPQPDDVEDPITDVLMPSIPSSTYMTQPQNPQDRYDELDLLRSPHPTPAQVAHYPDNLPVREFPLEALPSSEEPARFNIHERTAMMLSGPQIDESRWRCDMEEAFMANQHMSMGMGIAPIELSGGYSNYDMSAILAYSRLSIELQVAEDAAASEQASTGTIIADVGALMAGSDINNNNDEDGDGDGGEGEDDAGYQSDAATATSTSVTPSVWEHAFENGRRYHRYHEGAYHFPNDDVEQGREDMKHSMVKMLCHHKLHFAPIGPEPQEILDIGTGTGNWAMEMGESYPSACILGIDLSPIQPNWVPPNVKFMVDDVESPWLHPKNHFDYIHSRHIVMAIRDWDTLLGRCYEHVKPGGWVELQEIHHVPMSNNRAGGAMPRGHPVEEYWRHVGEGLARLGVDLGLFSSAGAGAARRLRRAGFANVRQRVFHVPVGAWPLNAALKIVGLFWKTILLDGLQAIALRPLMRGLRWTRDQVEAFLVTVRRAYQDFSCQIYMPLVCVYGQKPLDAC